METAMRGVGTVARPHVLEPFGLRIVRDSTGFVLVLSGEFDLASYMRFEEEVRDLEPGFSELVLDLRETTFIDSIGLRSLVQVWQRSQREGFELAIVNGPAQVRRIFDVTGFSSVMPLVD
jgi:anti-sigma B factor antagonist